MTWEPTEAELMAAVTEAADLGGWMVYHTHDSRRSRPGFPDLVLAGHGRVMFIELKAKGGRVTPAQRDWLLRLYGCGADARLVKGRGMVDDLIYELSHRGARL